MQRVMVVVSDYNTLLIARVTIGNAGFFFVEV